MRKFSKIVAFALSIVAAFSLIGCGGKPNDNVPEEKSYTVNFDIPATTGAKISVAVPDNDSERQKINALISAFNTKYPLIDVSVNTPFSADNTVERCINQFNANLLADIVWCNSTNYYGMVANGIFLNLEDFVSQAKTAGVFDYENDFDTAFQSMGRVQGKLYAIGRSVDSVVTFYNKKMLAAAGDFVDTSLIRNGWTWNDFLTVCSQLRAYYDSFGGKYEKVYPVDANVGWESVGYPIIKSFGGEVINDNGEFSLTEEQSGKVFDLINNLTEERYISSKNDAISSFVSAADDTDVRTALIFQSASIDHYEERYPLDLKGNIDVVSFPLINGENSAIGFGFAGYGVNSKIVDNQDKLNAVMAFMTYLMSYDGQQAMAENGGLTTPSIRKDLSETNPDAKWCAKHKDTCNMAAYTYGAQYKVGMDFLANVKATLTGDIVSNLNKYTGSYCISKTKADAYRLFRAGINEAFDDV